MEEAKEDLKFAWETDQRTPKWFPENTDEVRFQVTRQLVRLDVEEREPLKLPLPDPDPPEESLCNLINEKLVKAVYAQQNADSYKEALRDASQGGRYGSTAFHKILKCLKPAYMMEFYGIDLPRPKIHVLHRGSVGNFRTVDNRRS